MIILPIVVLLMFLFFIILYPFLAINKPINAEVLVVEGWLPKKYLNAAIDEYKTNKYRYVCTTGPIRSVSLGGSSYAEYAAREMIKAGMDSTKIFAVPAPDVPIHRTIASARALRKYFKAHDPTITSINIVTAGPHARKTYTIFKRTLTNVNVGIISTVSRKKTPFRLWYSSGMVAWTLSLFVGYIYALIWPIDPD